ncbi:MAG TPA: sigma-70 family RNA polymerase sigma factor [Enhygromyxa sp.]|nr:sigma-70 family RNA polymerase sigma factor [Enhygromyxa sp.]
MTRGHDDAADLDAWRAGDRAAGERLFDRYYEPVARFFVNKVGDASPDLIQRTFLACVEGMERFRGEGSFRSYLFAIAYRQLCLHYRNRDSDRVDPTSVSAHALDPSLSRLIVEREELQLLLAALRELTLDLQVVLELHYWEECTTVEIAAALEIPEGTVKSRLRSGREKLRANIERLAAHPELAASTLRGLATWAREVRATSRRTPE